MSEDQRKIDVLTRRKALKRIAGTAGAVAAFPNLCNAETASTARSGVSAFAGPAAYLPKFFNAGQMETIAALAETIIPTDEHSSGARAARVHEFIDTIVSQSSQKQKEDWVAGLAAVNLRAESDYQKQFAQCTTEEQSELLLKISAHEEDPKTAEEHFFVAVKNATIEGYYTSEIGIHQELEYQGNTAMGDFEGCNHLPQETEHH